MQYFGGKARVGQQIADYINSIRKPGQTYWEPFVGGAWVMCRVLDSGPRLGSDICSPLISLYNALQQGWEPPQVVTEEDYQQAKQGNVEPHLQAFIGFGCSFAGKWFGGFARGGHGADAPAATRSLRSNLERNYAANAKSSLLKKSQGLHNVPFFSVDYRQAFMPRGWVIYCDPPYMGTTGYAAAGTFSTDEFWKMVDMWAEHNTVLVSEYAAPDDWQCVLSIPTRTDIRNAAKELEPRMEKVFAKNLPVTLDVLQEAA